MAGPWALQRIRESGVPYAITTFPDGGVPFAGTQGFFINAQSENKLLAQAFLLEFIATEDVMLKLFEVGQRPPAYLPALEKVDDPDIKAFAEAGENAVMMPAIPAMALSGAAGTMQLSWRVMRRRIRTLLCKPLARTSAT